MNTPPPEPEFDIISTIRSDGTLLYSKHNTRVNAESPTQFYMLRYHRDRMLAAAKAFRRDTSPLEGTEGLTKLMGILHDHLEKKYNDRNFGSPLMV